MTSLSLRNLSKSFGATSVINDLSLSIESGDLFFILGASGCGKSTLLRIIAGLEVPDSGEVFADGIDITSVSARQRGIGMVFQNYALWPHMTVAQNVGFGLEVQRVSRSERAARIREALELVRMENLGERYPHQISGGQQQRVALARALAVRPKIVLLDEPLSNLDARLRDEIRHELQELHRSLQVTMVFVTHDQEDALTLATKVALLRSGGVVQVGSPEDLYNNPASIYAAEFLGAANILRCSIVSHPDQDQDLVEIELEGGLGDRLQARKPTGVSGSAGHICVRPEAVSLEPYRADGDVNGLVATVSHLAYKGSLVDIECRLRNGRILRVRRTASAPREFIYPGAQVQLGWSRNSAVLVDGIADATL